MRKEVDCMERGDMVRQTGEGRMGKKAWSRGFGASCRVRAGDGCKPASVTEEGDCTVNKDWGSPE